MEIWPNDRFPTSSDALVATPAPRLHFTYDLLVRFSGTAIFFQCHHALQDRINTTQARRPLRDTADQCDPGWRCARFGLPSSQPPGSSQAAGEWWEPRGS